MQAPGTTPKVHKIGKSGDCSVVVIKMSPEAIELARDAMQLAAPQLMQKPPIRVMGRDCRMPRNVGLFSLPNPETGAPMVPGYRFSGQTVPSMVASGPIGELISAINEMFGTNSNAVLVNEYPAGDKSSIGAHSDDEKGLDTSRGVFGINLYDEIPNGKLRKMVFREKATGEKFEIILEPNTIFGMVGEKFQEQFTHAIPAAKGAAGRISATFRSHVEKEAPKHVTGAKRRAEEAPGAEESKRPRA